VFLLHINQHKEANVVFSVLNHGVSIYLYIVCIKENQEDHVAIAMGRGENQVPKLFYDSIE
jgi:hypothetical protein